MPAFFRLVTRWDPSEVEERLRRIDSGRLHPRDAKMALAREIVAIYHGEDKVDGAEENFRRVYQERGTPEALEDLPRLGKTLQDLVASVPSVNSRSEARRLIEQRGVRIDGEVWADPKMPTEGAEGKTIQIGPTRFFRIGRPSAR
jgi:tyrosyl-tRNA synthetase